MMRSDRAKRAWLFRRDQRGVITLEFALTAPIILGIIFGIIEFCLLALKVLMLDAAVGETARTIYIGGAVDQAAMTTQICDSAFLITDCENNLRIEAMEMASFTAAPDDTVECLDSDVGAALTPASNFQTGAGNSIITLRVCATTDLILPFWGFGSFLTKTDGGRFQIVSSLAFQNEPF